MPVTWRIEPTGLVVLTSDCSATFDEWLKALNAAAGAPEWRSRPSVLHDCRAVERIPSTAEAKSRGLFVARRAKALGIERWAAVVPEAASKQEAYGLAAFTADRDTVWCRTFTDLDEARRWVERASDDKVAV